MLEWRHNPSSVGVLLIDDLEKSIGLNRPSTRAFVSIELRCHFTTKLASSISVLYEMRHIPIACGVLQKR